MERLHLLDSGFMDPPRLEHVRVKVSDFARAVMWYESILGLPAQSHWPPEVPKYAHTGSAQFALSEMEPVPATGRYNFSVRAVDAWWANLRDRADVVEPLMDTPYGTRNFTIRDPDGNELGFVRRLTRRPSARELPADQGRELDPVQPGN